MSYQINYSKVRGIFVYLELRSTRRLVGKLEKIQNGFSFSYSEKYINYKKAIPLGPEFPLTKKYFESERIFPSFWDRIPSKDNPAYAEYCRSFGIDPKEEDVIILLATIGSRGPSSFIFVPDWQDSFSGKDLKIFRSKLGLTTRDFGACFSVAPSTVTRIENGNISGSEVIKFLEILYKFPDAAAYYIKQHSSSNHLNIKNDKNPSSPGDLKTLRSSLGLTTRDFSTCFGMSQYTIKLLRILYEFPEAASYYIEKYGGSLHSKTRNKVLVDLRAKHLSGWADTLHEDEFNFSKQASEKLKTVPWAEKFLDDKKIKNALNYKSSEDPYKRQVRTVKSSLFEIRFAYSIYKAGLKAEYEYKTGVGNSSIDFRIISQNKLSPSWLVELTSLGDSEAVKENTVIKGDAHRFSSLTTPWDKENSPEVRDLIKVQQAILNKVSRISKDEMKIIPIKFPKISEEDDHAQTYHVIIIDIRGFGAGISDFYDYMNILYGSQGLDDVYKREWIEKDGSKKLIKGVFDHEHPDPRAHILQERVHAIGFIDEKNFNEDEILTQLKLYPNKKFTNLQKIRDLWSSTG